VSIIDDSFKSSVVVGKVEPIPKQVESVIEEEVEEGIYTN